MQSFEVQSLLINCEPPQTHLITCVDKLQIYALSGSGNTVPFLSKGGGVEQSRLLYIVDKHRKTHYRWLRHRPFWNYRFL